MPDSRYRCTWDDIAWLDCDYMASWGAFNAGGSHSIDFHDDDMLPTLAFEMAEDGQSFSAAYQWRQFGEKPSGDFIRNRVRLEHRPCRFGGTRAYFRCPFCGKVTLRLAVLPEGLRCGTCGLVTWGSRRERQVGRAIRKANKVAVKLGLDNWMDEPVKRPPYMRTSTFERLKAERAALVAAINADLFRKLARKGMLDVLAMMSR